MIGVLEPREEKINGTQDYKQIFKTQTTAFSCLRAYQVERLDREIFIMLDHLSGLALMKKRGRKSTILLMRIGFLSMVLSNLIGRQGQIGKKVCYMALFFQPQMLLII